MRTLTHDDFLRRTNVPDESGCMLWTGAQAGAGYPQFKKGYAHRYSYEYFIGPIPEGLTIDHLCRNRLCVNPSHLEAVTQGENVLRGDTVAARNKAKTHCPKGHPYEVYGRACRECHRVDMRRRRGVMTDVTVPHTHCKHGHEFTEANTWIEQNKNNARHCRTCHRLNEAKRRNQ